MRMLMMARLPHETFNAAVRDGSADRKMQAILDEIHPEMVYFTEMNGQRAAIMIVDMKNPSQVPALAEPWFLTFKADVEFHVVMRPQDLQEAGLEKIGKRWT